MKRLTIALIGFFVLATAAAAQEPPPPETLPEFQAPVETPPVEAPSETLPEFELLEPTVPAEQPPETLPEETEPTPPPLSMEASEALPVLVSAHNDLELLADQALGRDQRPAGWSGSVDVSDPNLPLFIRLDLEVLAGTVLGNDVRPAGWFGVVPSSPLAIARDIRHDLELLADTVVGASTLRPGSWAGDDPIMRCNRATQALVPLLERAGFALNVDFTQLDYCQQIEIQASRFVETQIIQPPVAGGAAPVVAGVAQPYLTETPFVVAFYDTNARRRAGVLPVGTGFRPVSRSDFEFSNMMLIEGEGFSIFVDYTTTPMSLAEFEALPVRSVSTSTNCAAAWCSQ